MLMHRVYETFNMHTAKDAQIAIRIANITVPSVTIV